MTSTGMNTFGGAGLGTEEPTARPKVRLPRRAALVTALGVLTVVGAAGAYLGVVDGLGSLLNTSQAEAGTMPPAPGETNSGIGRGPVKVKNRISPADQPATTPMPPRAAHAPHGSDAAGAAGTVGVVGATALAEARRTSPIRTTNPATGECGCVSNPPAPTPTAPQSAPEPSDSAYPSHSAEPSPSETSGTPGDSATPSDSPQPRHRRWSH
jgi:hypothetical protein